MLLMTGSTEDKHAASKLTASGTGIQAFSERSDLILFGQSVGHPWTHTKANESCMSVEDIIFVLKEYIVNLERSSPALQPPLLLGSTCTIW